MLNLIKSPLTNTFGKFVDSIETSCFICSPYITSAPINQLVKTSNKKEFEKRIKIDILTNISFQNLIHGGTEISALLHLFDTKHDISITYLPRLHAKVYIANQSSAIISSANFTYGGEKRNFEYGVEVTNSAVVQEIQQDMNEYSKLGVNVTKSELENIKNQVEDIKHTIQNEQKTIRDTIHLNSTKQQQQIEDDLIRTRIKGDNINSIFSNTLLYLLSQRPATTRELNLQIQNIHPDLCDNTDRVIDGKAFGKLWKHSVRNAQVSLKKSGILYRDEKTKLWQKTEN